MAGSHRLFLCAGCLRQVRICTQCDRGNHYCSKRCARFARCRSLREAGKRYQKTLDGRRKHAARQLRYRLKQINKVTHQGPHKGAVEIRSETVTANVFKKQPAVNKEESREKAKQTLSTNDTNAESCCYLCGQPCGEYTRLGPLRRRRTRTGRHRQARPPVAKVYGA